MDNWSLAGTENWDERRWEREIRRDERRINCYFSELETCLDLPGEDEIMFNRLASVPDLIPPGESPESLRERFIIREENENQEPERRNHRMPGENIVERLDAMATEWNAVISGLPMTLDPLTLGVSCALGKLLARAADFVDTDEKSEHGLKLALGKRCIADIGALSAALENILARRRSLAGTVKKNIAMLEMMKPQISELMNNLCGKSNQ